MHPTASSLSTVLGFGEHCDVGGRELLTAYVTAMESIIRIGMAAMGGLHRWGCAAGINAAYLAKNGFVGPTCPYEGRFGLYKCHLHDDEEHIDYECLFAGLGS